MYNWSFILPAIPLKLLTDLRLAHSPNSDLMFWGRKPETPYILVSKSGSFTQPNKTPRTCQRACSSLPSFPFSMSVESPLTQIYDEKLNQTEGDESRLPEGVESFANSLEERVLVRKLDKRILPLTCLLYLFACSSFSSFNSQELMQVCFNHNPALDRSNLGNARLQGLPEDVLGGDKTGVLFDWLTSGFYFSYVCLSWMTLKTTS